jgi:putative transcriptional regulator
MGPRLGHNGVTMDLTNHFLIAMPSLGDPNFQKTVTFMCAHNSEGAMGIVINRPTELTLGEMLRHMHLDVPQDDPVRPELAQPVLEGGPVQRERGFVLHEPEQSWDSVLRVSKEVAIATSKDILTAVADGRGPPRMLVALGYAGWAGGQLEQELLNNAWLSGPAEPGIIFDTPFEQRWDTAARALGFDPTHLVDGAGHG